MNDLLELMVDRQLNRRGIGDVKVLEAFRKVDRRLFVAESDQAYAYDDRPLTIGFGQTISQPYIVALMTQLLRLKGKEKILEVGAGSGYQTAILAELGDEVYAIERIPELAASAEKRLSDLGYNRVHIRSGDGSVGWVEAAPFDCILVAAAAPSISASLSKQLKPGGRMVAPIGTRMSQQLFLIEKDANNVIKVSRNDRCVFVPLIGKEGWPIV